MKRARIITVVLVTVLVAVCLVGLQCVSAQPAIKPVKLKVAGVFL